MRHKPFHPVIFLPDDYEIYDFSAEYNPNRRLKSDFGIGKYNEHRPTMYTEAQFTKSSRTVHMGIDIAAPAGTPVYAFDDGIIFDQAYRSAPQDYGGTIITQHQLQGRTLYVLYGHLRKTSILIRQKNQRFQKGEILAHLGEKEENGGWNPHLHIQLSWKKPEDCDMLGAVSLKDREQALLDYPDPQIILGKLY